MQTFYIFNAGCIRRALDCIWIKNYLQRNNWHMVSSPKSADLIVVSSCGVVKKNEQNSLIAIKNAVQSKKEKATIAITGCLPEINPEEINKLGNFHFVPSGSLHKLDNIISPNTPLHEIEHPDTVEDGGPITDYLIARSFCRKSKIYKTLFGKYAMNNAFLKASVGAGKAIIQTKKIFFDKKTQLIRPYYNIKVADGCKSVCTYCATRFAIRKLKSRPLDAILKDFRSGLKKGYKTFQLLGEDSGCYGLDINSSITELLEKIFEISGKYELILIDFNPWWLIKQQERLIPLLSKNQNKVKEIFLPFQSGSDKILRLMKREYNSGQLTSALLLLQEKAPEIIIRTSALIGFPLEDEEDFEATKKIIRQVHFAEVAINRYEDRPNTPSSTMPGKVPQQIIEKRAQYLVDHMNCKMLS